MDTRLSRRQFLAGAAALVAGASFGLPGCASSNDDLAKDGAVVILHTNDIHCAVGEPDDTGATPLGFAALASYAEDCRNIYGKGNVTLVDAGDAVQGKVMGTLTKGQAIIDIMNECGYTYAIPGNHEFDFGMEQFNRLVSTAGAKYLSCNFTDKRTDEPALMFDSYALREYTLPSKKGIKIAYVGVTTPSTLSASSPRSFWRSESDHSCVYGFCEDETGDALADAVQAAVDAARGAGADYVVLLAHLGQGGEPAKWRSDTIVSRCRGIDVVIDGHSHEEYVQVAKDAENKDVIITQTGTQFSSVGQIIINPASGFIFASTPHSEAVLLREAREEDDAECVKEAVFGRDKQVQSAVDKKSVLVKKQTGTVVGKSSVKLYAYENDGHTWAVRSHETNLGDFVADAYLYYAQNNGVDADFAFINGGGVRADIPAGAITRGDLVNVNPFNNQLCYTKVAGQDLLDALEVAVRDLPEETGDFLHVSEGFSFVVNADVDSPVKESEEGFEGIDDGALRRVRSVKLHGKAIKPDASYTMVFISHYLVDGAGLFTMLNKNPVTLLGLDNDALVEYLRVNLDGKIGKDYAVPAGQGRIILNAKGN